MAKFIGMDFAFAKSGLAILDENANIISEGVIVTSPKHSDEERLIQILDVLNKLDQTDIKLVYLEGLSYGSQGRSVSQIGAVHYLTRIFLYKNKINYKIISPSELKKFITGKGNAKKDLMLLNIYKKFGIAYEDDNLADAYSLARMALEEYGHSK
jgi:crossover junction endodeoxyribonuclease RuvC